MSSTIENKVVKVSFDHKDFDKGLDESKKELEKYEKKLKMDDGVKALSAFQKSLNAIDLSGFSKSINAIEGRLSTFGIMGAEITRKVTDSMISAVTNLYATTMGQIKSGGKARATNIEQAHFLLQGLLGDEEKVQEIMDVAMDSVDGTAYGFDQAAKAAAQFVASGLTADELVTPLKAVAGVAATTSSDYSALANIFTKIAGQGRAMTGELNQLSSYGINAAATLAEYFNGVSDGTIQVSKEVQNEINGAWAKAEVSDKVKDMLGEGGKMTEGAIRELASQSAITFRIFSDALGQRFGEHAKKANETVNGPNGKETYYNLPMHGVVQIMRDAGFSEAEYPYWIRDDGCKMLGDYIMVAADLSIRPRGSIIETSLGTALVCDTGSFVNYNATQIDVAVNW